MVMPQTENDSMIALQDRGWHIIPLNVSVLEVDPPASYIELTDAEPQGWEHEKETSGRDLATRMTQDKGFIQDTERGLVEIEQGRYSKIEDIKKKLGDL